jgi:OOP family OmpA-OmpF porin
MAIKTSAVFAVSMALVGYTGLAVAAEHMDSEEYADSGYQSGGHSDYDTGVYLGASVGATWYSDDGKLDGYNLDDSDIGWSLFGGYRINRYIGVEGGYVNLGEYKATSSSNNTADSFDAFYLAAVGILPFGEHWQLRAKAGGGIMKLDQSFSSQDDARDEGGTYILGVGGRWAPDFFYGVALNLNYDTYFFTVEQLDVDYDQWIGLLSLGVDYQF